MRKTMWAAALVFTLVATAAAPAFASGGGADGPDWAAAARGAGGGAAPESTVRSPFALADTPGDVPNGSGDITAIKVEHRTDTVRLTVRTKLGSNPSAGASWRSGDTWIIWAIDVNNAGDADFLAGIFNQDGEVFAEVVRNNPNTFTHRCNPTFTHNQPTQFQIEFPRSCISSHPSIRAYATMQYNRTPATPSTPEQVDYSPNLTWTPLVTR